jgi:transposase
MSSTHCVGIDVSKAKFDFAFVNNQQVQYEGVCENSPEAITTWIQRLETHGVQKSTPCVLESTGIYHVPVSLMLRDSGYTVNCINPIITKSYQLASIRGAKTDTIDARRLAEIGMREMGLPLFQATKEALYSKRLTSTLATLEKLQQSLALSLATLRESEKMLGVSEPAISKSVLKELRKTAQQLEEKIIARAPISAQKLSATPGVSARAAALLMSHLEGRSFGHRDQLVAFFGLDVRVIQSGTFRGRGKLSKRGDSYMRKILHQIAWGLKMYDPFYKKLFTDYRAARRPYKECLTIIARKFLRHVYAQYLNCPQVGVAGHL